MLKFIRWIVGLTAVIISLTAIALNPQTTQFYWNPAAEALTTPVYLIIIATFIFGYIIGALYLWLNHLPKRIEANKARKHQEKTIKKLEQELEAYQTKETISTDIE